MDIGELLDRNAVAPKVAAASKRQALAVAAEMAARHFNLKASAVLDALVEREQGGSTGVGYGVAVPHARAPGLDRMRALFLRLETPVDFDAVDDLPVDILFVLLAPETAGVDHLRALARVSRLLRQAEVREQLRKASSVDAVYALLVHQAQPSAA